MVRSARLLLDVGVGVGAEAEEVLEAGGRDADRAAVDEHAESLFGVESEESS